MTDEPTPAATPQEGTQQAEEAPQAPDTGAPEGTPEVNWEQRYNDLRPQYDRTQTLVDRARQGDEQALTELLPGYGFQDPDQEFDDLEDPLEFDDPVEELRHELDQVKGQLTSEQEVKQQAQFEQAENDWIGGSIDELEGQLSEEFTDQERQAIGDLSKTMRNDQGYPDVAGAHEAIFKTVLEGRRAKWMDSKKRAPQVQSGSQAEGQPNLDDPKARREYMAERLSQDQ